MAWVDENIVWILIVCGLLNFSAASFALAPRWAFRFAFGHVLTEDPAVRVLVRTLGVIVSAVGILLIMAAYEESARFWVLIFASAGKIAFAGQLIAHGRRYGSTQAYLAAMIDLAMVIVFLLYLAAP